MTRDTDKYISLKYRCDFANRNNADLFVSIHCNSNPKSGNRHGNRNLCLQPPGIKLAAVVAAQENAGNTSTTLGFDAGRSKPSVLIKNEASQNMPRSRIIRSRMKQHIRYIQKAPFYVLRQVDMPSILVETAFISNPKEEVKLRDPYWRDNIAKSIADGILSFRDIVESTSENKQARR